MVPNPPGLTPSARPTSAVHGHRACAGSGAPHRSSHRHVRPVVHGRLLRSHHPPAGRCEFIASPSWPTVPPKVQPNRASAVVTSLSRRGTQTRGKPRGVHSARGFHAHPGERGESRPWRPWLTRWSRPQIDAPHDPTRRRFAPPTACPGTVWRRPPTSVLPLDFRSSAPSFLVLWGVWWDLLEILRYQCERPVSAP